MSRVIGCRFTLRRSTLDRDTDHTPGKIVCVGRNYRDHAKEMGNDVPKEPLIFLKPPSQRDRERRRRSCLPPQSTQVEHEGEIGVVIGRTLRRATSEEARGGDREYRRGNDVTARDLQRSDSQWTRAKGFDTFCPIGRAGSAARRPVRPHRRDARQRTWNVSAATGI